ncbi:S-layer homology domain-containing protein [Planktothrix pseudagardhii]|uniref:Cellulosome-anchoring protein n=1 Tax=Planktothrix pseudagardhii TaxID=132604 RepID=A0A9W4CWE9_9CYAN|nr:S-layer homology domain-containing protein [Planktothrix pseudagardhii]CAD5929870.1 Cellulosome-anchoring protein [Planktothrix pseudagardhii]
MKKKFYLPQLKLFIVVLLGVILTHKSLPLVYPVLAQNPKTFEDIKGHWAQNCIEELAQKNIVKGYYEDDTFRPDEPVNRAEFAAIISQAFPKIPKTEKAIDFVDVPTDYWAYKAIQNVNQRGFMSGYLGSIFNPLLNIPRVQALVALVNGLDYKPSQVSSQQLTQIFEDGSDIPEYAKKAIATAAENWLVVNYPNVRRLNPNKPATRAEVATFVCQAISADQKQALVPTQYIARVAISEPSQAQSEPKPKPSTPAVTMQPQTTPPIESRPESYPEIKDLKVQKTAKLGDIKAELLADSESTIQLMQIKITRKGELVSEDVVTMATLAAPGVKTVKTGRVLDFKVLDLDNDKEPEILVDLLIDEDNNRKSYSSVIYRYSPIKKEYRDVQQKWGLTSYRLNTENLETPILIHYDQRFSQQFQAYTPEQLPLQIFQYQFGEFQDVTQQYKEFLKEHNSVLLQEINKRRRLKQDLKAVVAAYLAQQYLLGDANAGWKTIEELYQNPDRNQFFPQLRQWLKKTGYTEGSS